MSGRVFVCDDCGLVLDDGVDYTWCPKCSGAVRRIEDANPAAPIVRGEPGAAFRLARRWFTAVAVLVVAIALADPRHEPFARLALFAAQAAAAAIVVGIAFGAKDVRALVRDRRTRVLHGIEHATIKVLEDAGLEIIAGCTYDGFFMLETPHDGRWWERVDEVRAAAHAAIARIRGGEVALAYDPRCGTSRVVASMVVALAVAGVGFASLLGEVPVPIAIAATVGSVGVAWLAARALGLAAQRAFTVSTALASASVTEVTRRAYADASGIEFIVAIDVIVRDDTGRAQAVSL